MLPQIFVSLKFFILSLLAVYQADNPHFCPSVLKTLDDYQSCHLKALYDFDQCINEQWACLNNCANFANEANRFSFKDQPVLTGFTKVGIAMLGSSCNAICKSPYNPVAGLPCLDQKRREKNAWLRMSCFEKDQRTEEQKTEDAWRLWVGSEEQSILYDAGLKYVVADPKIYLRTIPEELSEDEKGSLRSDTQFLSNQERSKLNKLYSRWSWRNFYLHQKELTNQIEAMIKYWESHTDFATKYVRPECPILSKKSKNQCIRSFVDSLQHRDYLYKRSKVMHELQRRKLQHKAIMVCEELPSKTQKRKKEIKAPQKKTAYFVGETPKRLYVNQQTRMPKNKAQFRLGYR